MSSKFQGARWIWCDRNPERPNRYAYFRRSFELDRDHGVVCLRCSADMRYRLFANGTCLGDGPAKFHRPEPAYESYDITSLVGPGRNVVAFLVHGMGGEPCTSFMPTRCALIAALKWEGGKLQTDSTWKAYRETAYREDTPRMSAHQGYVESFDARACLRGWEGPEFDDSGWPDAVELGPESLSPWERLVPRGVRNLSVRRLFPCRITESGLSLAPPELDPLDMSTQAELLFASEHRPTGTLEGEESLRPVLRAPEDPRRGVYVVFDFGEIWPGYPRIVVEGDPGTVVDLGYGESFSRLGRVETFKQRNRCADRLILGSGRTEHQILMPKCLRYLHVEVRSGSARIHEVSHEVSTYPVEWRGSFHCDDEKLKAIWKIGAHTTHICMEDVFVDTPWRERSGWMGDDIISTRAAYAAFGETEVARRSLALFMKSQGEDGRVLGRYPSAPECHIPTWSACYAPALADYVRYSGDLSLAGDLWPGFLCLTGYFERHRTEEDLLAGFPADPGRDYVLLDWAPIEMKGAVTGLNAFYVNYLDQLAWLAERLDEGATGERLRELSRRTRLAIQRLCWDPGRGMFVDCRYDGKLSRRVAQHENVLALLWGIATDEQAEAMVRKLFPTDEPPPVWRSEEGSDWKSLATGTYQWESDEPVPSGTPYFSYYVVRALFECGRTTAALNYIRKHWGSFLARGATTVWERWAGNTSLSHAWSSGPTPLLGEYVLGVVPLEPGFERVGVCPSFGDLGEASGRFPTPRGTVEVAWKTGEVTSLRVSAPPGIEVEAGLPISEVDGTIEVNARAFPADRTRELRRGAYRVARA